MLNFEVFSYADVNSSHLSEADKALLTKLDSTQLDINDELGLVNLVVIGRHTEAWFVALGNEFTDEDEAYLVEVGFSADFAKLIAELTRQDIYYVRFDEEGYDVEGARRYK